MQRMLNRDLTPVMRSLLGVHQNRESEKKPPLAVQLKTRTVTATSADDVSRAIKMLPMAETVISHRKTSSPKSKYKNSPHLRSRRRFVFLARRKKTRGRARGEKERRHPLPFGCSLARALNKNKWQLLRWPERQRRVEETHSRDGTNYDQGFFSSESENQRSLVAWQIQVRWIHQVRVPVKYRDKSGIEQISV